MWYRLRQFWRAVTARMHQSDYAIVQQHLSECEKSLFFQMAVFDQRHCIDTALLARTLGQAVGLDEKQLKLVVKVALLHDVGKIAGDVGVIDRVLITLLQAVLPALVKKCAATGFCRMQANSRKTGFLHACYVHRFHPERGARMLKSCGCELAVVRLVEMHHACTIPKSFVGIEAKLLAILQAADKAN